MGPEPTYDWEAIETDYVTGRLSYRQIAKKYKVSEGRVGIIGGQRDWSTKRKQYREKLVQEAIDRTMEVQVADKVEFDVLTDNACDGMLRRIARAVVEDNFTAKDLLQLPGALKTIQDVKYRRLDIAAPLQRHEISDITPPGESEDEELADLVDEAMQEYHGNGYDASGDGHTDDQSD